VVLLAGLPGDVESENAYRDQLQTWLEIIASGGGAHRLVVLFDHPESLSLPSQPPAEVFPANRTNFLNLAGTFAGTTNPLVVIAWGHGGKQGQTSVFHVRGPRLTPSDFQALADKASDVESRWLLLFRGSGAFASALVRANRQILSSECETMFNSDPVGLPVLLKLARSEPSPSFESLSEQFGRNTAAWYQTRNLARTEEPTLWAGLEKPRLLAGASEGNTLASNPAEAAAESTTTTNVLASAAPRNGSDKLPAAWKDIKRVEPRLYPDADGVTLRRRLSYTLGSNPAIAAEQEEFIQVLTPEGKRLGDFDISYSPPFEDLIFLDCEVLRPDGELTRLDPDAIRDAQNQSVADYQAGQRKFFSLGGVVPGAVLHVRYRRQWKSFPMPNVSLEIPLTQELPSLETKVQVSVPKDLPFHFALENLPAPAVKGLGMTIDPVIKQGNYGTTYSWQFDNLPAPEAELLTAPHREARLLISTFPDWEAFASWYARISKLTDEATPELEAKAAELTRDAKGDREKVVALFNYVTSLRYVAVPLGVNSFRPHAAANVLRNQYGDCKDKANLFNALLHTLKIPAHLVLVPRFSQANDGIPGLSFNHAISRVTLGGDFIWVDTTDDICRFGMLPPGDPGRKVLVIDGESKTLTQLPEPDPKEHQLKLHAEFDGSNPATEMPVSFQATAMGYPDYELREAARATQRHAGSLPLLEARFRPVNGSFALDKQTATAVSALGENFAWTAEGTVVGASSVRGSNGTLRAPFWLPKEWELSLHHRKAPLYLNQGYPLLLEEEFEFSLPPKTGLVRLPANCENAAEPLKWRLTWKQAGETRLTASLRAELAHGELTEHETDTIRKQLRSLLTALGASASFALPP
jgi:hypothetical protein